MCTDGPGAWREAPGAQQGAHPRQPHLLRLPAALTGATPTRAGAGGGGRIGGSFAPPRTCVQTRLLHLSAVPSSLLKGTWFQIVKQVN